VVGRTRTHCLAQEVEQCGGRIGGQDGSGSTTGASLLMLFTPGAPREFHFEGLPRLGELTEDERREFFDRNDNFFPEPPDIKDAYP
jgi:hypothetical protein